MDIMLEITPPSRRSNPNTIKSVANGIKEKIKTAKHIDYINIPEIIEENFVGMPLYKHTDVCEFAALLQKTTGKEVIANKVVVHLESEQKFKAWLKNSISNCGLHNFVFVGGNKDPKSYPGPSVGRCNDIASSTKGIRIGNICIPSRAHELDRLVEKTKKGASFFTTQLIFESRLTSKLLEDYNSACINMKMKPAEFFISIAPVASTFDLDFIKWLGAHVPKGTERRLINSKSMDDESIKIATETLLDIIKFAENKKIDVPISVNIETISRSNIDPALRLLESLSTA